MADHVDISNPDAIDLSNFLPLDKVSRLVGLRVYNCGQGDSIGVLGHIKENGSEQVFLSMDYGGKAHHPFKRNYDMSEHEWPTVENSGFLFTHWDQDHYWTSLKTIHCLDRPHLFPRQKVPPSAALFSATLKEARCWPENFIAQPHKIKVGEDDEIWIEKIAPKPNVSGNNENRNHTGLAMSLVKNVGKRNQELIIAPGDAALHKIPHLRTLRNQSKLVGLVAYHHGAHTDWSTQIESMLKSGATVDDPLVVFSSAGSSLCYGHPTTIAKDGYKRGFNQNVRFAETSQIGTDFIDFRF